MATTATAEIDLSDGRWISKTSACNVMGISRSTFDELVEARELTVRAIPGAVTRVRASDVAALIDRYTRTATGQGE